MRSNYEHLSDTQNLVLDIARVSRNHQIPGSDEHENVVLHSFGVAMLAWQLHDELGLDLDQAKIFKYSLIHDFAERGGEPRYERLRQSDGTRGKRRERTTREGKARP